MEAAWAGDRQPTVLDSWNLIIIREASIGRTILVGLLPRLSHDSGIGRNGLFFNERCYARLDLHFRYIHESKRIRRDVQENEAGIDIEVAAVGIREVRHPPLGFEEIADSKVKHDGFMIN